MKTETKTEPTRTTYLQMIGIALRNLKRRLQLDYERAYPELRELIRLILDEEESRAWDLTLFPHLLLPDLVEAHVAQLNLRPVKTRQADLFTTRERDQFQDKQPIYALCA